MRIWEIFSTFFIDLVKTDLFVPLSQTVLTTWVALNIASLQYPWLLWAGWKHRPTDTLPSGYTDCSYEGGESSKWYLRRSDSPSASSRYLESQHLGARDRRKIRSSSLSWPTWDLFQQKIKQKDSLQKKHPSLLPTLLWPDEPRAHTKGAGRRNQPWWNSDAKPHWWPLPTIWSPSIQLVSFLLSPREGLQNPHLVMY